MLSTGHAPSWRVVCSKNAATMQLSPVAGGGETVLNEPLSLGVSFDGGVAPLKSFKDAAWALTGTLTLLEGGEPVELSDAACLGEGVPQPEQDEEGNWLLTLTPASPGLLSLTLTLTGPKNFSLEAALQHRIRPLPTPQELLEAAVAAGDEAALSKLLGEHAELEWSWDNAAGLPLLAVLCSAPVEEEVRARLRLRVTLTLTRTRTRATRALTLTLTLPRCRAWRGSTAGSTCWACTLRRACARPG